MIHVDGMLDAGTSRTCSWSDVQLVMGAGRYTIILDKRCFKTSFKREMEIEMVRERR